MHKSIGTSGTEPGCEVVDALTGDTPLEERLLTAGEKDVSAPASCFRHRILRDAVFDGDATCGFLQVDGTAGKMAEADTPHPP